MDLNHSNFCKQSRPLELDNYEDINEEINNYKRLKQTLTEYLNNHPLISEKRFLEKSLKFYNKIKCKFDIKQHTFHNIFKSWKATTKLYTKFSVLENCLTRDNKQYLKDYNYSLIYNQNGKQQFIHELMIFISNFFIRKLNQANH